MNKKLMIITTLVLVMVMAAGGTALAGNGFGEGVEDPVNTPVEDGLGSRYGASEDRGSGQMSGTCDTEGLNPDRPVDGWGVSGTGNAGGNGYKGGNGQAGERLMDCEEGEPLLDGSGTPAESGNGYRGGNGNK